MRHGSRRRQQARGYDIDTLLVDAGVRDADPLLPGNQAMIYIQANSSARSVMSIARATKRTSPILRALKS